MKKIPLIRRKDLVNAGVKNSQLIHLSQRNQHFKNRMGDQTFFTPFDTLLIFIATELFNFLPFRNASKVVDDIVKLHRNLYGLLKQNQKQFLVVELISEQILPRIPLDWYVVYPILVDSLNVLDWQNRKGMLLVNLEKIYLRIEELFEREGLNVSFEGHWEAE